MTVVATPTPTSTTRVVELPNGLPVRITEFGRPTDGTGVLILHGGAGARSVMGFATAMSEHAYVVVPTHPGFDGTARPESTDSVADLATAYLDLIDELGLNGVMVVGSSIGGWIASEMSLRDNHQTLSALILLDAVGIEPDAPLEIGDPAKLGPVKTGELAFYRPELRPNPAAFTDEQKAGAVANQRTQGIYAAGNFDPKLRGRLHRVTVPVLVLNGVEDGIVPLEYAHALTRSFPRAIFRSIPEAGHFPHIEQPGAVFGAIGDFVETVVKPAI